jgi:Glycosyl transferases group 1/Glycosyltransferase Family 4
MINILFIAYEFPPLNRGGVHRSLAFVKYLPQYGINPVVVTLDQASYPVVFNEYGLDEFLGKDTRDRTEIIGIKSEKSAPQGRMAEFTSIYFSMHGNEVRHWKRNFYEALPGIMEKFKPAAVFATLPPFSVLPLALAVANKYKLPLLLDFRDAWSQWRTVPFGTRIHYWVNLMFEKRYLLKAAAVIATSGQTIEDFKKLYPQISGSKFFYIPNGYDGLLDHWSPIDVQKKIISVGYVGSFYYSPAAREQMLAPWWRKRGHRMLQYIPQRQDWLYRSPYFFFKTLQYIRGHYPDISEKIKVRFVGKTPSWLTEMIKESGLGGQIELLGEKSHQEALAFQKQCDLLLITSAKRIGGKDYSVAGKTFEYIQSQKPILAFVSNGAQKELLEKTGMALLCDPDEVRESAERIVRFLRGEKTLQPEIDYIDSLSRQRQTGELSKILFSVVGKNG